MNKLITLLAITTLASCSDCEVSYEGDSELERNLFKECMELASGTSKEGHYNDNSEVVQSCSSRAYYRSKVKIEKCEEQNENS